MAEQDYELVERHLYNPHGTTPLVIPYLVMCNTARDEITANVKANSARDVPWVAAAEPHSRPAILVGGGPSAADHIDDIRALKAAGGVVFAMNGASRWLASKGIAVDYQVISDAKPVTATLIDPDSGAQLIASQVNPKTMDAAPRPLIWHFASDDIEDCLPPEKVRSGGYALIGGGSTTGICALCLAYAMGHRSHHVFGFDSSHRAGAGHAYAQPMNDGIPIVDVTWAGRTFIASVSMKLQADRFQITAKALQEEGAALHVYGDGLLQHMWRNQLENKAA